MKISDLRECVVLGETLSFTETARRLYTTQSALSKHIQAIERDLDAQLFVRDHNGVQVTPFGQVFIADAEDIITRYEQALINLNRAKAGFDDVIAVGYLAGASSLFLADVVERFSTIYPAVDLELESLEIDGMVDRLESGLLDVGIAINFVPFPSSRYCSEPLYKDEVNVIVPKGHRLAGREVLSVNDLEGETILMPSPLFMKREVPLFKNLLLPVREHILVKESLRDFPSLFTIMRSGKYVTLFFNHASHHADNTEHFDFIPLREMPEKLHVVAVWDKARETDAVRAFVDIIKETVEQIGLPQW